MIGEIKGVKNGRMVVSIAKEIGGPNKGGPNKKMRLYGSYIYIHYGRFALIELIWTETPHTYLSFDIYVHPKPPIPVSSGSAKHDM